MTYPGAVHRNSGGEAKIQSLTADRLDFLFSTRLLPCPYLPAREERKIVIGLAEDLAGGLAEDRAGGLAEDRARVLAENRAGRDYTRLIRAGYRRSGVIAYRHACPTCRACVPVRLPIAGFQPGKSLRRAENINFDLDVRILPPRAQADHFELFRRYQDGRHTDGEMADMDFAEYRALVEESPVATRVAEYRNPGGELMAVSLFDELDDSLSAVYTFFEPSEAKRSLGTFMILWLARHARDAEKSHLYLGYWIENCAKMAYKARFRPLEMLDRGVWQPML